MQPSQHLISNTIVRLLELTYLGSVFVHLAFNHTNEIKPHQGVTYLKYELEGREVILDEDGEDILGQWNAATQTIDPYDGPDLGIDATEEAAGVANEDVAEKDE